MHDVQIRFSLILDYDIFVIRIFIVTVLFFVFLFFQFIKKSLCELFLCIDT